MVPTRESYARFAKVTTSKSPKVPAISSSRNSLNVIGCDGVARYIVEFGIVARVVEGYLAYARRHANGPQCGGRFFKLAMQELAEIIPFGEVIVEVFAEVVAQRRYV